MGQSLSGLDWFLNWENIRHVASWALLVGGGFFTLVGALGLVKLKDVFARMHTDIFIAGRVSLDVRGP